MSYADAATLAALTKMQKGQLGCLAALPTTTAYSVAVGTLVVAPVLVWSVLGTIMGQVGLWNGLPVVDCPGLGLLVYGVAFPLVGNGIQQYEPAAVPSNVVEQATGCVPAGSTISPSPPPPASPPRAPPLDNNSNPELPAPAVPSIVERQEPGDSRPAAGSWAAIPLAQGSTLTLLSDNEARSAILAWCPHIECVTASIESFQYSTAADEALALRSELYRLKYACEAIQKWATNGTTEWDEKKISKAWIKARNMKDVVVDAADATDRLVKKCGGLAALDPGDWKVDVYRSVNKLWGFFTTKALAAR